MLTWTRRAFVAAVLAIGVGLGVGAADPPEPVIEFDGRVHQNPKVLPGGEVRVTGVVRPPTGHTVTKLVVEHLSVRASNLGPYTTTEATIDTTKSPPTWSAEIAPTREPGDYWVQARLYTVTPDGARMSYDHTERRRVYMPGKK